MVSNVSLFSLAPSPFFIILSPCFFFLSLPTCSNLTGFLDVSSSSICPFLRARHIRSSIFPYSVAFALGENEENICRNNAADHPAQNKDYYDREHLQHADAGTHLDSLGEVSRGTEKKGVSRARGGFVGRKESRIFLDVRVATRWRARSSLFNLLAACACTTITRFTRNLHGN